MPPALLSLLDRIGGPRRATILIVGLAAALGVFGLARWASAPAWVPAFGDVPIGDVGALTDRLQQAGIQFKLGGGGNTILVQSTDVAKARVALARAGVLPQTDRPGYELFDTQQPFGTTEVMQRVNLRRALEGELERTIGSMRGIKRARVSLVMPESESYGSAPPPAEASVVLESQGVDAISPDVVKGIARTVAASVEGLTSDHVTIVDDAGRPLTEGDEGSSPTALSNRQLEHQLEVERSMREKVERLLVPVLGSGNAKVQVNATLSFDRVERTSQTVDPDRQAVVTEQKNELIPGTDGGAAQTQTAASYVNSTATESVSSAIGSVKRLSVAVVLATPAPAAAGAAAPTDTTALRSQVETLVKSAVGFDETRGDVVTVAMLPFALARVIPPAAAPTTFEQIQQVQRPALSALGILFAFVIALLALRAAGKTSETVTPLTAGAQAAAYLPNAGGAMQPALANAYAGGHGLHAGDHGHAPAAPSLPPRPVPQIHIPNNPIREQVVAAVDQQPDVAAKLMRAWLRDG